MTNWQITAKTVYCDTVEDEVTLMVYKDGSAKCTGLKKYDQPNSVMRRIINRKSQQLRRPIRCSGVECPRLLVYKEKILAEETK